MLQSLSNRDLALLIWVSVALAFLARDTNVRNAFIRLVRSFFNPKLVVVWAVMGLYVYGEVVALSRLSIWDISHLKVTVIWAVTVAVVMVAQVNSAATFRKAAIANFQVTVILDFLVNLYVFSFVAELLFVPVMTLLGMMLAYAQVNPEYKDVAKVLGFVVSAVGLFLLAYAGYSIYSNFSSFARAETAKDFAAPLLLSLLYLPFIYAWLVFTKYERLWTLVTFFVKDKGLAHYMKRQLLMKGLVDIEKLERWGSHMPAAHLKSRQDVIDFVLRPIRPRGAAPAGFRGLTWASPPHSEMTRAELSLSDEAAVYVPNPSKSAEPCLGFPVAEACFSFTHNRFYSGSVWIDGQSNLSPLKEALIAMYGPPTFQNPDSQLWKWRWPEEDIEIELYQDKRPMLTMRNNQI